MNFFKSLFWGAYYWASNFFSGSGAPPPPAPAGMTSTACYAKDFYIDVFEFSEIAPPSSPGASKAVLYIKDNGSGKTQLAIKYPGGSENIIDTEP